MNELLKSRGSAPVSRESLISYIGGGIRSMIEDLDHQALESLGTLAELERDFLPMYDKAYLEGSHIFEGVTDFLKSCTQKLAVLSNKKEKYVKSLIENTELSEFNWEIILGGDSLSTNKPDPEGVHLILNETGASPQKTAIIGDGRPDIKVANNAGIKSIAVDFGYTPIEQLLKLGAHGQISHFSQLPQTLTSIFTP